jgi:hypothetical protein
MVHPPASWPHWPKPYAQATEQVEAPQTGTMLTRPLGTVQALPQVPQLAVSLVRSTSHAFEASKSQFAVPAEQAVDEQRPAAQEAIWDWSVGQ